MTRADLIVRIARCQSYFSEQNTERAVKALLAYLGEALAHGEHIEICGFGSFAGRFQSPRRGRHPKTGAAVEVPGKYTVHFKPGKELRHRVNHTDEKAKSEGKG